MTNPELARRYREYIDCLNRRDWESSGEFVHQQVVHNDRALGLSGYREMLERDVAAIPDLHFRIELLVTEAPQVASRLRFDCRPAGRFLDLDLDGREVSFSENVIYQFRDSKIVRVWSVIDKLAIEAQLRSAASR